MKFIISFLIILFILIIAITFGANNDQLVSFNYLIDEGQFRLSTLLALLLGIGFILGWLITGVFYLKVKFRLGAVQRKLKKLEKIHQTETANSRKSELIQKDTVN
ncbi:lipopolysaccharide assembly protein LapA domain-containing protein [Utexia brackfieldae]|uniref:LapA family protein n=1 Tax=Utexia brackfieldae TaxID=3074108 RepID=UPI00370D0DE7